MPTISRYILLVTASIALGAAEHAPSARAEDAQSDVTICSSYDQDISVMVIHPYTFQPDQTLMRGWYVVKSKECQPIGSVPRGPFFIYGEAADRKTEWRGDATFACLARRATERILYQGEECVAGETKKGFFKKSADGAKTTVQLN
jgi:uncharacterized membrane protein